MIYDKTEREFIREKITEAKWLANAISKRNGPNICLGKGILAAIKNAGQ